MIILVIVKILYTFAQKLKRYTYMNFIFIFSALVCCLLAFFVDGLYLRDSKSYRCHRLYAKKLFFHLMFLSVVSLSIGVILTIAS